jgi:TRAP-type C4-dicarboxylate transport system permease small subunit
MTPPEAGERRRVSPEHVMMNIAFVVLACAIIWGVLSRYVTDAPATWVEEVSSIAFAWVVFMGAAEAHRRGKHVSVDLITSFLPGPLRRLLSVAIAIYVAAYCCYIAWLGALEAIASNSAHTSMLNIPRSVPYAGLTLGFLAMGLRGLRHLVHHARQAGS